MTTLYRPLHRITRSDPPTRDDFLSQAAQGIPAARHTPELVRINDGISTFATEHQARAKAQDCPFLHARIGVTIGT